MPKIIWALHYLRIWSCLLHSLVLCFEGFVDDAFFVVYHGQIKWNSNSSAYFKETTLSKDESCTKNKKSRVAHQMLNDIWLYHMTQKRPPTSETEASNAS